MPSTTAPNLGMKYAWAIGDNFKPEMDANLLLIDRVLQLSVKDRDLTAPPGGLTAGDRYIVAASPTGAWVGQAQNIAVWTGSTWAFITPKLGWISYIEDEQKISVFRSGAWSAGIAI